MTGEDGLDGTDEAAPSAGGGLPVEGHPGLRAGDFAGGEGVLGVAREPQPEASGWGPDAGPKDPTDIYEWMRRLGDQGIAYQVKDGKISVFTRLDPKFGSRAETTVEAFDGDPATWSNLPKQNLSHPVVQNLKAYGTALDYLKGYPGAAGLLDLAAHTPVVVIPGTPDRYTPTVDPRPGYRTPSAPVPAADPGVVYWDPTVGMQVSPYAQQSPALALFHEFGHAQRYRSVPGDIATRGTFFGDFYTPVSNGYDNAEEERNIKDVETPAAQALGHAPRSSFGHSAGVWTYRPFSEASEVSLNK